MKDQWKFFILGVIILAGAVIERRVRFFYYIGAILLILSFLAWFDDEMGRAKKQGRKKNAWKK